MNRPKTLWWAGTAVIALVSAAACWFLALSPVLEAADTASAEAEASEQTNHTRSLEVQRLAAAQENLPALQAELEGLRRQFPTDLELEAFVQRLADLAGRSGATVATVARTAPVLSDARGTDRLYRVGVTLTVEGTFDQQLQYLSDLQAQDDRLFLVTAATDLSRSDTMTITGSTFVLVDAAAVQPAETPAEEAADPDGEASP